jgi:anti-sigma regulatory factor (Ser/Thr protein kinase)
MLTIELPPTAQAVPAARAALDVLRGRVSGPALEDARLLLSELVTNSVRHAGLDEEQRIEVAARVANGVLRVEVRDEGPGFVETSRERQASSDSGWGLYLVSRLADRWGVQRGSATLVWFEIASERAGH